MSAYPQWLSEILVTEVDVVIDTDPRTLKTAGTYLGYPRERIFPDIICGGQADFDCPIGEITGDDRAILYAKYNQRRHLDELIHAFRKLFPEASHARNTTVLDLGCGPFTAGLSMAAAIGSSEAFRYFGIDSAKSMQRLGERFMKVAKEKGALNIRTSCWFGDSLDQATFGPVRAEWTLVVASYLLASPDIDINEIVSSLDGALNKIGPGPSAVLFTNTARPEANEKYPAFRDALLDVGFRVEAEDEERFSGTKTPIPMRYSLFVRDAKEILTIRKF